MMANTSMFVACDEAGHTGPDLLQADQTHFSYASVALSDAEAWKVIDQARRNNQVQMPELKGNKLLKSSKGRALVAEVIQSVDGRFAVNVHNKLLALCGWVFEYIVEPVYKDDPSLLYQKNLHRFVAMFTWMWLTHDKGHVPEFLEQFQDYMRVKDASLAPLIFDQDWPELSDDLSEHPFELIMRFAAGYKDEIISDNSDLKEILPDNGTWVLDLSASALWSHLNHWGQSQIPLEVICDVSKPLQASINDFRGDESDPAIVRARIMGYNQPLGWDLHKPVEFVDSRDHPSVQIADIIASTTVSVISKGAAPELSETVEIIQKNMLQDTILPSYEVIDLSNREAAVNFVMLYDLAKRASAHADPAENLKEMYFAAEVGWAKGDFPKIQKSAFEKN